MQDENSPMRNISKLHEWSNWCEFGFYGGEVKENNEANEVCRRLSKILKIKSNKSGHNQRSYSSRVGA